MKKFTFLTTMILCSIIFNMSAQQFIKIDASFYSEALDEVKMVDIYLPGDYYQNPELQYATIYYLHGAGGNQNSGYENATWYYNLHSDNTTITSPPAIFVCPDGSCPPYMGSDYVNSELYGNYEDFIMQDVIGFIENNFRAYPDKNFRMITGKSMGGFGSSRLAATYPEKFRASFPYIGIPSMPDTLLNAWKDLYYQEHGNYIPALTGWNTQLLLTMCGGLSPNMSNPPTYVDFPFDTLGNWVDTILNKWYNYDVSRLVRNLPDENELAWFLGCGTTDYLCTYPAYLQFMDSLDYYNIAYDYHFFEGDHIFNPETWMNGMLWMDSIINQSFIIEGISPSNSIQGQITIYPNPVKDILTVNFDGKMTMFEIINTTGRVVKSQKIEIQNNKMRPFHIDLSNLPPGIYFLRLQAGNDVVTKKVVKL